MKSDEKCSVASNIDFQGLVSNSFSVCMARRIYFLVKMSNGKLGLAAFWCSCELLVSVPPGAPGINDGGTFLAEAHRRFFDRICRIFWF